MIARASPDPAPSDQAPDEQQATQPYPSNKPLTPFWVGLPNALLQNPPIRHRGERPELGLTVFEFALGSGLLLLARMQIGSDRYQYAWVAGKHAIKESRVAFKARAEKRRNRSQSKSRSKTDYRPRDLSSYEEFQIEGSQGYDDGARAFNRKRGIAPVTVRTSKRGLFRAANVSLNRQNQARLQSALQRLQQRVGTLPPVIRKVLRDRKGGLAFEVDATWVPLGEFATVPWPVPTSGATVLALYLFCFGADLRQNSRTTIRPERLYRYIGIPRSRPAHEERALARALERVNAHLRKLDGLGELTEAELPIGFKIEPTHGGRRIRIRPVLATPQREASPTTDDAKQDAEQDASEQKGDEQDEEDVVESEAEVSAWWYEQSGIAQAPDENEIRQAHRKLGLGPDEGVSDADIVRLRWERQRRVDRRHEPQHEDFRTSLRTVMNPKRSSYDPKSSKSVAPTTRGRSSYDPPSVAPTTRTKR
jgi:hypothetical protein